MLEGLDGSGTTTQLRLLSERLAREGIRHTATFEPTEGPIGALLRSILARKASAHPRTVALLFAADRSEHVFGPDDGIEARTRRGELVVSDRYLFSSLAYQSIECGLEWVSALNEGFPLPQTAIFIDTPVEVCQERLARRSLTELYDGTSFQARVRQTYLEVFERYRGSGMRIELIDGNRPAGLIHGDIWKIVGPMPIKGT